MLDLGGKLEIVVFIGDNLILRLSISIPPFMICIYTLIKKILHCYWRKFWSCSMLQCDPMLCDFICWLPWCNWSCKQSCLISIHFPLEYSVAKKCVKPKHTKFSRHNGQEVISCFVRVSGSRNNKMVIKKTML
jgi:hypothetical protein